MPYAKDNRVRYHKTVEVPRTHLLLHLSVIQLLVQKWENPANAESLQRSSSIFSSDTARNLRGMLACPAGMASGDAIGTSAM